MLFGCFYLLRFTIGVECNNFILFKIFNYNKNENDFKIYNY
jgi:hypothetical protein